MKIIKDNIILTQEDIISLNDIKDCTRTILVRRLETLRDEYRSWKYRLFLADDGFGCILGKSGTKIFGTFLYDGEECQSIRSDYNGILKPEVYLELKEKGFLNNFKIVLNDYKIEQEVSHE